MTIENAAVVICGAGLAGVSAAYYLAVQEGLRDIALVDERPPLSLTSDHSTECYRNWWLGPDAAMVEFMNHSIDLLDELARRNANVFHLNRRGYLYCTGDPNGLDGFIAQAEKVSQLGAGALRIQRGADAAYPPAPPEGFSDQPDGADLLLDPQLIQARFPFLSRSVSAALHVRRAGWLSAQQLGVFLLHQARQNGVRLVEGRVSGVDLQGGRVHSVQLQDGRRFRSGIFVNAAGPFLAPVGRMVGVELPVYNELHLKLAFTDAHAALDRTSPLVIWSDAQTLDWTDEERAALSEDPETRPLLELLPSGVHARPDGGGGSQIALALWEYQTRRQAPVFPIPEDPLYPETALRGLTRLIPGMQAYVERPPRPRLDGGYYTRTPENRPLIGGLPVEGAFVIGGLSGFGVMAACAAGELLAKTVAGTPPPGYAAAFALERFQDPNYLLKFDQMENAGQL
ncbi:MAG: FAD-binding oxidoreductase [Anaerolineae bacterium]|jgi:glycine/D-amino acid oxidase-like deaminating enzyme|nr:FAD-binding oxidoreductase [Anaerolineae bacterium]MCZ7553293.1 FAD-binding oxidoreductase [Anaerolineales bacterium]